MRWPHIIMFHQVFTFDTAKIYCNWNMASTTIGKRQVQQLQNGKYHNWKTSITAIGKWDIANTALIIQIQR